MLRQIFEKNCALSGGSGVKLQQRTGVALLSRNAKEKAPSSQGQGLDQIVPPLAWDPGVLRAFERGTHDQPGPAENQCHHG